MANIFRQMKNAKCLGLKKNDETDVCVVWERQIKFVSLTYPRRGSSSIWYSQDGPVVSSRGGSFSLRWWDWCLPDLFGVLPCVIQATWHCVQKAVSRLSGTLEYPPSFRVKYPYIYPNR